MTSPPPLAGLRVVEFAGLAPGPFTGLLLADFGATVLRIDRPIDGATHSDELPLATTDSLVRRKSSICVDLKCPDGLALLCKIIESADVLIDPFRPGVLERLGLGPQQVHKINPSCIFARMTGFRRDGKYSQSAGHDINYLAVSGVLSMLGQKDENPTPPGNLLGDFAGGGAVCFLGILLALIERTKTGRGQVVEANMVDGSAYMATFARLAMTPRRSGLPAIWAGKRGTNLLDGGAPFYRTYKTKDGGWMSVGALEPQFYAALLDGLELSEEDLLGSRMNPRDWPAMTQVFEKVFLKKTRKEWEDIFDGTDACVAPVIGQHELKKADYEQRPIVHLSRSPGYALSTPSTTASGQGNGVEGNGWTEEGLQPSAQGESTLAQWLSWKRDRDFVVQQGGLVLKSTPKL